MSDDKIYLNKVTTPSSKKKKRGLASFFIILLALGVFFISPAPDFLISLIPDKLIKSVISPIYQDITLSDKPEQLTKPRKYSDTSFLQVLGYDSGICFLFNKENINKEISKRAFHGKEIAEIIAVSTKNKEYILDDVTLYEDNNTTTVICQRFGTRYSIIPEQVKAIYIRPLSNITPNKIKWITMKKL